MSLLIVKYDRRSERILEVEATELDAAAARRRVMALNENGLTRPAPHIIWMVRELGDAPTKPATVSELIANFERSLADARAARTEPTAVS